MEQGMNNGVYGMRFMMAEDEDEVYDYEEMKRLRDEADQVLVGFPQGWFADPFEVDIVDEEFLFLGFFDDEEEEAVEQEQEAPRRRDPEALPEEEDEDVDYGGLFGDDDDY